MERPEISIVIPAFNEEGNLVELVAEIHSALAGRSYEVLFVDDGSTDSTPEVLSCLAAENPRVRWRRFAVNRGQSAALAAGFCRARGAVVVTLDADLQNDPADIPRLLEALEGVDVVSGVRRVRHDSLLRRFSSRLANRVRNAVIHDSISDVGCSLKAYRAEFLRRVPPFDGMHRFLPALARMEGARVCEIPVSHRPRLSGESKYGIHNRLWRGLVDLAGVRWLQRRWIGLQETEEEIPPSTLRPPADGSASLTRRSSADDSPSGGSPRSADNRA